MATNEAAGLWHDVPRLDRPSRLWIIPADKATWVAAGKSAQRLGRGG